MPDPSTLSHWDGPQARNRFDEIVDLYAEVYAEPPYHEGPGEVIGFRESFLNQSRSRGFALVSAEVDARMVGFVFGFTLQPDTSWWSGLLGTLPDRAFTTESGDRTVAIIELVMRAPWRRQGVGGRMFDAFLAKRREDRATLLCRPEAFAAQAFYARRGWWRVGRVRPFEGAPVYDVMILRLR
ncbi:MAG: GNAT family N-acetyltransferase [Streptomycetales bacterium]